MVDRVPLVVDALVGGLDRFRDPVAFVFTLLDYLVIAFGVEGGVLAEGGGQSEFDTDNPVAWQVSTLPAGYRCPFETEPVEIGGVRFVICGRSAFDTAGCHTALVALKSVIECKYPGFPAEISGQFNDASQCWSKFLPYSSFGVSNAPPEATRKVGDSIRQRLRKYLRGSRFGDRQLGLALAFAEAEGQIKIWPADGDLPNATGATPEVVLRACATGFAQWSSSGDPRGVVAVPCVVGGFPWAIIYSACALPSWLQGYHLYRDVLPRLLEDIRGQARNAYLSALIATTDAVFSGERPSITLLNECWEELSRSFPFSVPKLPETLSSGAGDPDLLAMELKSASKSLQPVSNRYFPSVVGVGGSQTWGDIGDLEAVLTSAIGSRLAVVGFARANLAQAIAHEFKNLTSDLAVVAQDLERKTWASDTPPSVVRELAKTVGIQGQQLNGISLALFELASDGAEERFEASDDSIYLMRAAVRILLELRSITQDNFVVEDEVSFEDSVALLYGKYGTKSRRVSSRPFDSFRMLGRIINVTQVAFLLAAAAEPVRNVRVVEQLPGSDETVRAWTESDLARSQILLFQKTIEAAHTPRESILSRGAMRANRLLPGSFCRIDPSVYPVGEIKNLRPSGRGGVVVTRVTRIQVFGRPIPEVA